MGNNLFIFRLLCLAILFALVFSPTFLAEPKQPKSRVVYWSVGQGDFISFISPRVCLVFDVGGSFKIPNEDLIQMRNECPGRRVKLFVSHFDKDHISNYKRLMTYLTVEESYFSHLDSRSEFGRKLLEQLKFQNSKIFEIRQGFRALYGDAILRCLWPPKGPLRKAENDRSLVLKLEAAGRDFLFMGDLPSKMEKKLPPVMTQILKVGHHGSRYSSSDKFLKSAQPTLCIVSVGKINTYGHPNHEALKRMSDAHCTILRTDTLGNITIEL
jgi:competence protein ComEC